MKYKIRDLRNYSEAVKEKDVEKLAHDLVGYTCFTHVHPREIGSVIKKLKKTGKNFSKLKLKHTEKDRMLGK